MKIQPLDQTDFYKVNHYGMYPKRTVKIYSNETGRKSRLPGVTHLVVFGFQYFIIEYLMKQWREEFFVPVTTQMKYRWDIETGKLVSYGVPMDPIDLYKRMIDNTLGADTVSYEHLHQLRELGYLPLEIKVLPEGTLCPIGVPFMTITNTVDHAYWLVNYLETIISCSTWQAMVSATIAHEYRKLLDKYALETAGNTSFVQWQGHDFSMRGMSSLESACLSGAGHLLSFTGTDTIPAISFLEQYYGANVELELVGASVPATEHSVMCMGMKESEQQTFEDLLDKYPKNILSVVSDTWDLWKVITEYLPNLKDKIMAREGKLVIRPDSGDPCDILCGWNSKQYGNQMTMDEWTRNGLDTDEKIAAYTGRSIPEVKGVIQLLWEEFGGNENKEGYKSLNSHIGAIYGDSITLGRAEEICLRLKQKGFASTNVVLGIGSYTYQYNTRDTLGFAVKATYGEVINDNYEREGRNIFKNPVTDDGTKRSAKGLLMVDWEEDAKGKRDLVLSQEVPKTASIKGAPAENKGALETVFLDGKLLRFEALGEIRQRLENQRQ